MANDKIIDIWKAQGRWDKLNEIGIFKDKEQEEQYINEDLPDPRPIVSPEELLDEDWNNYTDGTRSIEPEPQKYIEPDQPKPLSRNINPQNFDLEFDKSLQTKKPKPIKIKSKLVSCRIPLNEYHKMQDIALMEHKTLNQVMKALLKKALEKR